MKKFITACVVLCLILLLVPPVSRASVTPYFVAANDTLLPFGEDTMPYISGGEMFVPDTIFSECDVWSLRSVEKEMVQLYGGGKHMYFSTSQNTTTDQEGNAISCSPAKRIGRRFYVPLMSVCEYFGLTCSELIEVPRDIIPNEQMYVLRVKSNAVFNDKTFVGINRAALASSYNAYFAPPPSPSPMVSQTPRPLPPPYEPEPEEPDPDPPSEEPSPTYSGVTVYLSFRDVSAGGAGMILDALNPPAAAGHPSCFFVSVEEIAENPELIRIISGSGHTVGIWLEEGTYEEYIEASALLFETAKVKTVIVSSAPPDEDDQSVAGMAESHGLIYCETTQEIIEDDDFTEDSVTDGLPTEVGDCANVSFACTEEQALILPGVLDYLHDKEYTILKITETNIP